jgi:hypothetical protein
LEQREITRPSQPSQGNINPNQEISKRFWVQIGQRVTSRHYAKNACVKKKGTNEYNGPLECSEILPRYDITLRPKNQAADN